MKTNNFTLWGVDSTRLGSDFSAPMEPLPILTAGIGAYSWVSADVYRSSLLSKKNAFDGFIEI